MFNFFFYSFHVLNVKIPSMKRILNFFFIFIIIILVFFVWHKILNQTFLAEGYYYFEPQQNLLVKNFTLTTLIHQSKNFDLLARIIFDIFPSVFKDNLVAYLYLEIIILCLLSVVIYITLKRLTKNQFVSFFSLFIFISSY